MRYPIRPDLASRGAIISAELLSRLPDFAVIARGPSSPSIPGYRGGIVVSIPPRPESTRRAGHVSSCAAAHIRSTPYFMVCTRDIPESQKPPAAVAAGCTLSPGYVMYKPVKGSVKISVTAASVRVVSASLSRLFAR